MNRFYGQYIKIPREDVVVMEDPMSFMGEIKIAITSMEVLDSIIEQCRDIKLKLMEG